MSRGRRGLSPVRMPVSPPTHEAPSRTGRQQHKVLCQTELPGCAIGSRHDAHPGRIRTCDLSLSRRSKPLSAHRRCSLAGEIRTPTSRLEAWRAEPLNTTATQSREPCRPQPFYRAPVGRSRSTKNPAVFASGQSEGSRDVGNCPDMNTGAGTLVRKEALTPLQPTAVDESSTISSPRVSSRRRV